MAMNAVSKEWWRDPRCHFGELTIDSPRLYQRDDIQPAIEFICAEFALSTNARILDLCCGPGRYAVELAHRGYDVVGLDINERYSALARQLAEREGVEATFLTGDMREIPFESHFDAIINVGTSFGFFDSEVGNRRVVKAVAEALKPKGVFLLEMGNRDYYLKNFRTKDWRRLENGRVIISQNEFDYVRGRML
jgi:D-alanine-D-alanine ligase